MEKKSISETHIASEQVPAIRLQEYGIGIFKTIFTKSALKKVLKKGLIYVNNDVATTATIIRGGELITLCHLNEKTNIKRFIFPLNIIFEDDYLAVINKPAGILVSGNTFKTIGNALAYNLQKSLQEDATIAKPAHRLDFPTTGALLVGKTSTTISALNTLFEKKKIYKTYFAITIGKMKKEKDISIPIDAKHALTTYKIIDTIGSGRFGCLNLVKLSPKTGRRHQLRKHMAILGNPILGDADYGSEDLILKGKGLYLHAFSLEFKHPKTQETLYAKVEPPTKFKKIFSVHFK